MRHMARLELLLFAVVVAVGCSGSRNTVPATDASSDASSNASSNASSGNQADAPGGQAPDGVSVARDNGAADRAPGASDAAYVPPANATQVCVAAIKALVERSNRCFGASADYRTYAAACPDYYFNADSNRTVAEVAACLDLLATQPCTDLFEGIVPSCVAPGNRPGGAGCLFSSQCQSTFCPTSGRACSTCRAQVPMGAKCDSAACGSDAFCDRNTYLCTPIGSLTYAAEGQSCNLYGKPVVGCVGDLDCPPTATSWAGVCTARPSGQNCGTVDCTTGSYCKDSAIGNCVVYATEGQPCGTTASAPTSACSPNLLCLNQKCITPRVVGQPCDTSNPCGSFLECVAGACRIMTCPE